MHHVLDGDAALRQCLGELCDSAGAVAHRHRELDQTAVGGEAPLQAAPEHGGVDVAAAEQSHHSADFSLPSLILNFSCKGGPAGFNTGN